MSTRPQVRRLSMRDAANIVYPANHQPSTSVPPVDPSVKSFDTQESTTSPKVNPVADLTAPPSNSEPTQATGLTTPPQDVLTAPYERNSTRFTPEAQMTSQDFTKPFTGVARTIVCVEHQGFRNYRIVDLFIENNQVTQKCYSDPFAAFEATAKLEIINDFATLKLNTGWTHGQGWKK